MNNTNIPKYTTYDKKKIVEKLGKLKDKKYYEHIFKNILVKNNIKFTKNNNGVFFDISLLSNSVISELNTYVDSILKNKKTEELTITPINITNSTLSETKSRINKLSNHEKNIIKRSKQHPKYESSETSDSNLSAVFGDSVVYKHYE